MKPTGHLSSQHTFYHKSLIKPLPQERHWYITETVMGACLYHMASGDEGGWVRRTLAQAWTSLIKSSPRHPRAQEDIIID